MGSPAVSLRSSPVRHWRIAGVFFGRFAAAARFADAAWQQAFAAEQLQAPAADGRGVQAEGQGRAAVPAATEAQGLCAGVQAPQALVEQSEEAGLRQVERRGRCGVVCRMGGGLGLRLAALELPAGAVRVGGAVEGAVVQGTAGDAPQCGKFAERVLGGDAEQVVEFPAGAALRGRAHKRLDGGQQCAMAGEAGRTVRPQAMVVEAGRLAQGVIAAAVGVGGDVVQGSELAQDSLPGGGSESVEQFGHGGHGLVEQQVTEGLRVEGGGPHNDTCTPHLQGCVNIMAQAGSG